MLKRGATAYSRGIQSDTGVKQAMCGIGLETAEAKLGWPLSLRMFGPTRGTNALAVGRRGQPVP